MFASKGASRQALRRRLAWASSLALGLGCGGQRGAEATRATLAPPPSPAPVASSSSDASGAPAPAGRPLLWSHDTGAHVAPTPVVSPDGKTVFFLSPQQGKAGALRASDGQPLWSVEVKQWLLAGQLSSDGATLFVLGDELRALRASDGTLKWASRTGDSFLGLGRRSQDDRLFVASNHDPGAESGREDAGRPVAPPRPNALHAFEPRQGKRAWSFARPSDERFEIPVVVGLDGALVYAATSEGVYALDAESGALRWQFARPLHESQLKVSLGHDGRTLYVVGLVSFGAPGTRAVVHALEATTGAPLWLSPVDSEVWVAPRESADGTTVYLATESGSLRALATADRRKIWAFQAPASLHEMTVSGRHGLVFVGSYDRSLHALDARSGAERWAHETGGVLYLRPVLSPDESTVFVGSQDGSVYALRAAAR